MAPPSSRILRPAGRAPSLLGDGTSRNNQTVREPKAAFTALADYYRG
jgi:hypothetical protein